MENEGTIAIPIIGYIIAVISPIIGLLYRAALVFFKKETPLYQKHGRFIIYFAIILFIIDVILRLVI
ncbi:hypothetical protein [Methanobrevibacter sp.]|uniref:hypothetical protein n=1 Tax=Methanobrevibacter sp. TaxID=66852 RepID=UPI00386AAA50